MSARADLARNTRWTGQGSDKLRHRALSHMCGQQDAGWNAGISRPNWLPFSGCK
jgi:hypothetical protein